MVPGQPWERLTHEVRKKMVNGYDLRQLAEGVGVEPTVGFPLRLISSQVP
jgi:hypothetical protein